MKLWRTAKTRRGASCAAGILMYCLVWLLGSVPASADTHIVSWNTYYKVPANATNIAQTCSGGIIQKDGWFLYWGSGAPYTGTNLHWLYAVDVGDGQLVILNTNHMINFQGYTNSLNVSNVVSIATPLYGLQANGNVFYYDMSGVQDPSIATNVVAMSGNGKVLKKDGTVQLLPGALNDNMPTNLTDVVAITGSMALRRNGTIAAWGSQSWLTNLPSGLSNVVEICFVSSYAEALKDDGTMFAWGPGATNFPAGLTNVTEIGPGYAVVDTDFPTRVKFSASSISNSVFSVSIPSLSSWVYGLEYTTNMNSPNWMPLPLAAGNGTNLTLTDTNLTDQQRFYRVRRWWGNWW